MGGPHRPGAGLEVTMTDPGIKGDTVTGAATVILAMGAGKTAAAAIHEELSKG